MNFHYLQHAAGEGPGQVAIWAAANGHNMTGTHWYRGDPSPDAAMIDFLVIMGGGMNIHQHDLYPWLVAEKALIAKVIGEGKPVLGICLGAQLIADVMGGKVYKNSQLEIGWFPIRTLDAALHQPFFSHFPAEFTALNWHEDTFDLPPGATLLASSDVTPRQAFVCNENIVGVQFHIEVRPEEVRAFVGGETEPLPEGEYVQTLEQILAGDSYTPQVHRLLGRMLDAMVAQME